MITLSPKNHTVDTKRGFTLVETLVAVSALTIAITAIMGLAHRGIATTTFARDQVIASYLAQDSAEYIISKRKQTLIDIGNATLDEDASWLTGFESCMTANGCTIDTTQQEDRPYGVACGSTCGVLRYDTTSGLYGYSPAWTATNFVRTIKIVEIADEEEAKVVIRVSWKNGLLSHHFDLVTNIFNVRL